MRYTKKACSQGMSEGLSLQVTIASIGSLFFHQNVHVKSEWIFLSFLTEKKSGISFNIECSIEIELFPTRGRP